jgi:hypothetical protein
MKTTTLIITLIVFFSMSIIAQEKGKNLEKLFNEAASMNKQFNKTGKGLAVVGTADYKVGRDADGMKSAKANALKQISEASGVYVEATYDEARESLGITPGSTEEKIINDVIRTTTAQYINTPIEKRYMWYHDKYSKKQGIKTWGVLVYIHPTKLINEFQENLKKKDEDLYKRYLNSELKEEHDKRIKIFEEKFGDN